MGWRKMSAHYLYTYSDIVFICRCYAFLAVKLLECISNSEYKHIVPFVCNPAL